jgi:hypothetical protein
MAKVPLCRARKSCSSFYRARRPSPRRRPGSWIAVPADAARVGGGGAPFRARPSFRPPRIDRTGCGSGTRAHDSVRSGASLLAGLCRVRVEVIRCERFDCLGLSGSTARRVRRVICLLPLLRILYSNFSSFNMWSWTSTSQ